MGDPKKIRKKYSTPSHPWQKGRIEEEIILKREYGLTNKKEIWIIVSKLKNFKDILKRLNSLTGAQADKEREQLKNKLLSLGLMTQESPLNTVLGLDTKDLMERRLQTMVFKKNLARSIKQARQFIIHKHILIDGKKITSPSHLVTINEEHKLSFAQTSSLADPNHPERFEEMPKDRELKKKEGKKKEETEEVAAFVDVPKDEEAIVKEVITKKEDAPVVEVKQDAPVAEVKEEKKVEKATAEEEVKEEAKPEAVDVPKEEVKEEKTPKTAPVEKVKEEEKPEVKK